MANAPIELRLGQQLFSKYRTERAGISKIPEMQYVCLICGSVHIERVPGDGQKWVCKDCGFKFSRYPCANCQTPLDARDPDLTKCTKCGALQCVCGACECMVAVAQQ